MASPLAKGLFQRAIGQSGGSFFTHVLPQLDDRGKVRLAICPRARRPQHR